MYSINYDYKKQNLRFQNKCIIILQLYEFTLTMFSFTWLWLVANLDFGDYGGHIIFIVSLVWVGLATIRCIAEKIVKTICKCKLLDLHNQNHIGTIMLEKFFGLMYSFFIFTNLISYFLQKYFFLKKLITPSNLKF